MRPSTTIAEACRRSGARWAEILEKDLSADPRRLVDGHDDGERDPRVLAGQHGISILADGLDHVLKLDPMANLWICPRVIDVPDGEALLHVRHRLPAHVPEEDLVVLGIGDDGPVVSVELEPRPESGLDRRRALDHAHGPALEGHQRGGRVLDLDGVLRGGYPADHGAHRP